MRIIVTGGAGFIGSCVVAELNKRGITNIIIVDHLGMGDKWKNLVSLKYERFIHKVDFLDELPELNDIEAVFHMGACSSTTEQDADYLMDNNVNFSVRLFDWCAAQGVRIIYASSAATYGDGSLGYADDESGAAIDSLVPLNMYGYTKKLVDQHVLHSNTKPPQWVGLKFFNVYGPGEHAKGRMASVIMHAYQEIKLTGAKELFNSYKKGIANGEQQRDFVYVKDCVSVMMFFMDHPDKSGIFNCGTGVARSFNDLAKATFSAMGLAPNIKYVEMPQDLRGKYQYFTQADMKKLRAAGYTKKFYSLEEGVTDYVQEHLMKEKPYS